jgi:small subunit ribosomal protein S4
VVYRLGFGLSRRQARQLVNHGHFMVNGKRVNIPSYQLKIGDMVAVAPKSREAGAIVEAARTAAVRRTPGWLSVDVAQLSGQMLSVPSRDQIDTQVDEALVVEFYSR